MILNGKKFEFGLCPSCDKRRPVWENDGLCYGCGGHGMLQGKEVNNEVKLKGEKDLWVKRQR
ncbi:hypothetical protein KAR91_38185 [Candidatus Pacearchaeota archaeon]|nr:hypothetical protein [Candidatus Pacearchaeota archaeon]